MAIDPKKIEEWNRILREVYPLGGMVYGQRERAERHAVELAAAVSALLSEREELLSLLRSMEWREDDVGVFVCPSCDEERDAGHATDCRLAALLAGTR